MRSLFIGLFWACPLLSEAQFRIHGTVFDAQTHIPLQGVSVILSGTTKGTVSGRAGEFQLENIRAGKYELVATSVNYEQYVLPVAGAPASEAILINMKPAITTLKEVIVEPFDEDGWDKYGAVFNDCFIGSGKFADQVRLVNPEVVKFRYNNVTNKLRAFSNEKLVFVNKGLGYRITYLLSKFEFDYNNNTFYFEGYPLFEELNSNSSLENSMWGRMRRNIYKGSLRHFIRSLYLDRLPQEGFEVRRVQFVTPEEIHRVKQLWVNLHDKKKHSSDSVKVDKDSMNYYLSVKSLGVGEDKIVSTSIVLADSLLSSSSEVNAKSVYFGNYLQVAFIKKRPPDEFAKTLPANRRNDVIRSEIHLRFDSPILIYPNGNYFHGLNLIVEGYWAWSEKISTLLPSDYSPDK